MDAVGDGGDGDVADGGDDNSDGATSCFDSDSGNSDNSEADDDDDVDDNDDEPFRFVVKRSNALTVVETRRLRFLDITNFIASGFSYEHYLKVYGCELAKGYFPYKWMLFTGEIKVHRPSSSGGLLLSVEGYWFD